MLSEDIVRMYRNWTKVVGYSFKQAYRGTGYSLENNDYISGNILANAVLLHMVRVRLF